MKSLVSTTSSPAGGADGHRGRLAHAIRAAAGAGLMLGTLVIAGAVAEPPTDPFVHQVRMPDGLDARSTAVFLTGPGGWTDEHEARAQRLTELHTMVIAIDGIRLLDRTGSDCAAVAHRIADTAARLQAREGALARAPVLAALAETSGLALALAHLRPQRFKGLVTDGYVAGRGPCALANLADLGGKAPLRWLDIVPVGAQSVAHGLAGVKVVEATAGPRTAFYRSYLGVAGTDSSFDVTPDTTPAGLVDLPLTIHEVPDQGPGDTYAIFLSGDGGWARFDEEISDLLAASGIPVVGISALRYLWREKQPEQIAADLARIDARFRHRFDRDQVLLIGFSIGANTMAFAGQHLTPDLRQRVAGIGLVAPENRTGFEIVIGGWLGRQTGAHEVAPAITDLVAEIGPGRIACLYGTEETVTPCPGLADLPMRRVAFDGGHHLGKDYARIAEALSGLISATETADAAAPRQLASGG